MATSIQDFAKHWRYNGVSVILDDFALQFAKEWAFFVVKTLEERRLEAENSQKVVIANG
jgi:hypothetical protein